MTADEANAIPLEQILDLVTATPGKSVGRELAYPAPWRDERTPSLHVNPAKNLWFDFGEGRGGSVLTFVSTHLERAGEAHTTADALRWLRNMTGQRPRLQPILCREQPRETDDRVLSLVKTQRLQHPALVDYLKSRNISQRSSSIHLKEAWLYNRKTKRHSFALALKNEEGGHELRSPYLKISLGKKGITFIRGKTAKPDGIHFFEGMMDFLSALEFYTIDRFNEDAIIFNSLSLMDQATPLLRGYGYRRAHTWLDNDAAGGRATEAMAVFCKTEKDLRHIPMNSLYEPHKDVNAWHAAKLNPQQ